MDTRLEAFAEASRRRAEAGMAESPLASLESLIDTLPAARPFGARLRGGAGPAPRIIAELKPRSPSAGVLQDPYQPRRVAIGYARVGAAAVSVLTEPEVFGGDMAHVIEARAAHLPILRKDFLVTPWQIAQSRVGGADAVLLIAAILTGPVLGAMIGAARRYGLEAIVEVHDEEDLARALDEGASIVGVNSRDLRTLEVDLGTAERLAPRLPGGICSVAESGIRTPGDLRRLAACGYDAFLIGETLLRTPDPGDALWRLMEGVR